MILSKEQAWERGQRLLSEFRGEGFTAADITALLAAVFIHLAQEVENPLTVAQALDNTAAGIRVIETLADEIETRKRNGYRDDA